MHKDVVHRVTQAISLSLYDINKKMKYIMNVVDGAVEAQQIVVNRQGDAVFVDKNIKDIIAANAELERLQGLREEKAVSASIHVVFEGITERDLRAQYEKETRIDAVDADFKEITSLTQREYKDYEAYQSRKDEATRKLELAKAYLPASGATLPRIIDETEFSPVETNGDDQTDTLFGKPGYSKAIEAQSNLGRTGETHDAERIIGETLFDPEEEKREEERRKANRRAMGTTENAEYKTQIERSLVTDNKTHSPAIQTLKADSPKKTMEEWKNEIRERIKARQRLLNQP